MMIIDMHSHILPGIDDGAKDWDEFLAMAEIAVAEGITQMVCSPHFIPYETLYSGETYAALLEEAKERLAERGLLLNLIAGSEVFFTADCLTFLSQGKLITINNNGKYLLIEFSRLDIPRDTQELLFALKLQGITPIIAHPERNKVFSRQPELLRKLINQGALCQLNTGSMMGVFGEEVGKTATLFLKSGMIHVLGSDAHTPRVRAPKFQQEIAVIEKVIGKEELLELVEINPLKIINGLELEPRQVDLFQGKKSFWGWITGSIKVCNQ